MYGLNQTMFYSAFHEMHLLFINKEIYVWVSD